MNEWGSDQRRICAALAVQMLDPAIEVVSLDVFDTVLLRGTKPEMHRFADIARRKLKHLAPTLGRQIGFADFLAARLLAAETAYRTADLVDGQREPHFDQILRLMADMLGIDHARLPELRAIELVYEKSVLSANRPLVVLVRKAKAAGKKIVFASDMYLSAAEIGNLIGALAPDCPIDFGYASADHGVSKRSGGLFTHMLGHLGVAPGAILHIGDNRLSDYDMPVKYGMRAFYWPRSRRWRKLHETRQYFYGVWLRSKGLIG